MERGCQQNDSFADGYFAGDVSVVVGDPFSLVVHGSADKKVRPSSAW